MLFFRRKVGNFMDDKDLDTVELPLFSCDDTITIQLPKFSQEYLDEMVELPKFNTEIINHYKSKIDDLENTTILDLSSFKTIEFTSSDKNECEYEFLESADVNLSNLEKTILIRVPSFVKNKKRYLQIEKYALYIIIAFSILSTTLIGMHLFTTIKSYDNTTKEIENINTYRNISSDDSNKEISVMNDNDTSSKTSNDNTMEMDFTKLKEINSDLEGWIKVENTNIDYPFVKTSDNDYYLNHSFYKKNSVTGWVFMDYRNTMNNLSSNNIIYAHNTNNGTMFGSLKKLLKETKSSKITIFTEEHKYEFKVFSVYVIPTTTDYLTTNFATLEEHQDFINMITSRSKYNFEDIVTTSDRILTLSTCYSHYSRVVVHAKLTAIE